MTQKLFEILSRRNQQRDASKPWVFWHRYRSEKEKGFKEGPFGDRKKIMKSLCKKAGVKYFRFHPLRHAGASMMDKHNVPMGAVDFYPRFKQEIEKFMASHEATPPPEQM